MIDGSIIGGFAAIMQWLVLSRRTAFRAAWWTIAGAVGGGAGYELGIVAFFASGFLRIQSLDVERAIGGAVGGATLGFIQWFFLRHTTRRAGLWVLANALGYGIAVPVLWNVWRFGETLRYAAMGAVVAAITGLVLAFILQPIRNRKRERLEPSAGGLSW